MVLKNYIMLLRVRIRELLSTALLEAPPNVNTSDQERWEANEGPRKFLGGHGPPGTLRNATGYYKVERYRDVYPSGHLQSMYYRFYLHHSVVFMQSVKL